MSMYIEFVAIITSRVVYLAFRQHRFAINFVGLEHGKIKSG